MVAPERTAFPAAFTIAGTGGRADASPPLRDILKTNRGLFNRMRLRLVTPARVVVFSLIGLRQNPANVASMLTRYSARLRCTLSKWGFVKAQSKLLSFTSYMMGAQS